MAKVMEIRHLYVTNDLSLSDHPLFGKYFIWADDERKWYFSRLAKDEIIPVYGKDWIYRVEFIEKIYLDLIIKNKLDLWKGMK